MLPTHMSSVVWKKYF